eukprot:scpid50810/ scgid31993/ GPI mannosyltransferase 2; GPI mannosyltransferase II; Phosphatidylinositol-glycan biosynthesis class V protein
MDTNEPNVASEKKDRNPVRFIAKIALFTRLLALIIQITHQCIVDFDSSACCMDQPEGRSRWLEFVFGGLTRWDSVYFLRIAKSGYEYEQFGAFFPLWPLTVRVVADTLLWPLSFSQATSQYERLVLSAVVCNTAFFCGAAVLLHHLTVKVTGDARLALCSALLFCVNPAMAFFSAAYTTSMFAFFSFAAMLLWRKGRTVSSTVMMMVTSGTRSNGIISCGFVLFECGYRCLNLWRRPKTAHTMRAIRVQIAVAVLRTVCICSPFIAFQLYMRRSFCHWFPYTYGDASLPQSSAGGVSTTDPPLSPQPIILPWCKSLLGLSYGYIQSTYWNVGFLRYFTVAQIPNFILASPMLIMPVAFSCTYVRRAWYSVSRLRMNEGRGLWSPCTFVFAVHWLAFTVLCFFTIHVQVVTRLMASATPVLYWYVADLLLAGHSAFILHPSGSVRYKGLDIKVPAQSKPHSTTLYYFLLYAYVGLVMHKSFYPWT